MTISSILSSSTDHVESLLSFVLDTKPYHTKVSEVVAEYFFEDIAAVVAKETPQFLGVIGPDYANKSSVPTRAVWKNSNVRLSSTLSAIRQFVSDGTVFSQKTPSTINAKKRSLTGLQTYTVGQHERVFSSAIPHLYDPGAYDIPFISNVKNGNIQLTEGIDYFKSLGIFSFEIMANQVWVQSDTKDIRAYEKNSGAIQYAPIVTQDTTITAITVPNNGPYEEWTLVWNEEAGTMSVTGSSSGLIGQAQLNVPFIHPKLTFLFKNTDVNAVGPQAGDGATFILTPASPITVHPSAPLETWSLIKVEPIALAARPVFTTTNTVAGASNATISVYSRGLDNTPAGDWTITFSTAGSYVISTTADVTGYPKTVSLYDGCSYKDEYLHFTINPTTGFIAGDKFTFTTLAAHKHYLVYGSQTGWSTPASIGEWYFNGKIGFKIPKLGIYAETETYAISTSTDGINWTGVFDSPHEYTEVQIINSHLMVTDSAITGAMQTIDGDAWTSGINGIAALNQKLVVVGDDSFLAVAQYGETVFTRKNVGTVGNLNDVITAPNIVIVGDGGLILTSPDGGVFNQQMSQTGHNLNSVASSGSLIIAVGDGGVVVYSTNGGTAWQLLDIGVTKNLNKIKFVDGQFIIVGQDGAVARSGVDLNTWNVQYVDQGLHIIDFAAVNNTFLFVTESGLAAQTNDFVQWDIYANRSFTAISSINGKFVAAESRIDRAVDISSTLIHSSYRPTKVTHTAAYSGTAPSIYASSFNRLHNKWESPLTFGSPWSNGELKWVINQNDTDPFFNGDRINVYLVENLSQGNDGYDTFPYDLNSYDSENILTTTPSNVFIEKYPLYYGHGCIIVPGANNGDTLSFDTARRESIEIELIPADGAAVNRALGPIGNKVPLYTQYFDKLAGTSQAALPDQATLMIAYAANNPTIEVFRVTQPRYNTSLLVSSATLQFNLDFITNYAPINTTISLLFRQADTWVDTARVHVVEQFNVYDRGRTVFFDGPALTGDTRTVRLPGEPPIIRGAYVSTINPALQEQYPNDTSMWYELVLTTQDPAHPFTLSMPDRLQWYGHTMSKMLEADSVIIHPSESGALPIEGYTIFPYNIGGYNSSFTGQLVQGVTVDANGNYVYTGDPADATRIGNITSSPSVSVREKDVEGAATAFKESLTFMERFVDTGDTNFIVDYDIETAPLLISVTATTYTLDHNYTGSTPNVIITPHNGAPYAATVTADALSGTLTFSVPPNAVPFTVQLV